MYYSISEEAFGSDECKRPKAMVQQLHCPTVHSDLSGSLYKSCDMSGLLLCSMLLPMVTLLLTYKLGNTHNSPDGHHITCTLTISNGVTCRKTRPYCILWAILWIWKYFQNLTTFPILHHKWQLYLNRFMFIKHCNVWICETWFQSFWGFPSLACPGSFQADLILNFLALFMKDLGSSCVQ